MSSRRDPRIAVLLESGEAIMVFPEGHRGFIKPHSKAYQLQRFGTGFARLALETKTPIVPVGIVGSEEQSPGLYDSKLLGRLIGSHYYVSHECRERVTAFAERLSDAVGPSRSALRRTRARIEAMADRQYREHGIKPDLRLPF